ncbi:MAG: response regulator [Candidatus Sericytochromatia bacterium]
MKLLLVEDDISMSLLFERRLTRLGYEVCVENSAEAAWERFQSEHFELVITDWVFSGMSGLELCKRLRLHPLGSYIYICVITARNAREDLLEVLEAGADDYLAKPLEIPLLEVRIRIAEQQVYHLQQRREAEAELSRYQAELEARVLARTEELSDMISALQDEISQRRNAEKRLAQTHMQLRALASHLISIQEEQQKRISREIHDELGQAMTALKIDLAWLNQQLTGQPLLEQKIQRMIPLVSDTITTIQRICAELRPGILDDLGLEAALEWLVQEFSERTGLMCKLQIDPEELDLPLPLSITLFRICQESLTNIMRHAEAQNVQLKLEKVGQAVSLQIQDDGKGIESSQINHPLSLGLMGMRERVLPWNGDVSIQGVQGKGTTIFVQVCLEEVIP